MQHFFRLLVRVVLKFRERSSVPPFIFAHADRLEKMAADHHAQLTTFPAYDDEAVVVLSLNLELLLFKAVIAAAVVGRPQSLPQLAAAIAAGALYIRTVLCYGRGGAYKLTRERES
jgi:hypothetical protein